MDQDKPRERAELPAVSLYRGETRHLRFKPFRQSFAYKLFLIDIDIDRLEEADKQTRLFAVDRLGLFSFRRKDHGSRLDTPLRPWAERNFLEAGIHLEGGAIRLVTLPRHLFYKFAPISLWFGYGYDGTLRGIIYEVNNTFGETHAYVAPIDSARTQHEAAKNLYVSPFFDVSGTYRFTLRAPDERLSLVIDNVLEGDRIHCATLKARRCAATDMAFLRASLMRPISTLGVTLGIHFEALKLWVKKAGYRSRPPAKATKVTIASPVSSLARQD